MQRAVICECGHTNYICIGIDTIVRYGRAGKKLLLGLRLAVYCDLNAERRIKRLRGIILYTR